MKHIALLAICTQFICCTTVTNPDGTTTKKFDNDAFGSIVGGIVTVGGMFQKQPQMGQRVEVTATK